MRVVLCVCELHIVNMKHLFTFFFSFFRFRQLPLPFVSNPVLIIGFQSLLETLSPEIDGVPLRGFWTFKRSLRFHSIRAVFMCVRVCVWVNKKWVFSYKYGTLVLVLSFLLVFIYSIYIVETCVYDTSLTNLKKFTINLIII